MYDVFFNQLFPGIRFQLLKDALLASSIDCGFQRKTIIGSSNTPPGFSQASADSKAGHRRAGDTINVLTYLEIIENALAVILGLKYRVGRKIANGVGIRLDIVEDFETGNLIVSVQASQHGNRCTETSLFRRYISRQEYPADQGLLPGVRIDLVCLPNWRFSRFLV